jgi:hypothetical protein
LDWLEGRVRQLEDRVARLERDSHPPVDLTPAIKAIVHSVIRKSPKGRIP